MKINGTITKIANYRSEKMDNDLVIYCEDSNKIIILNKTATLIFEEIIKRNIDDSDITCEELVKFLKVKFENSLPEDHNIFEDVVEIINIMLNTSLLIQ